MPLKPPPANTSKDARPAPLRLLPARWRDKFPAALAGSMALHGLIIALMWQQPAPPAPERLIELDLSDPTPAPAAAPEPTQVLEPTPAPEPTQVLEPTPEPTQVLEPPKPKPEAPPQPKSAEPPKPEPKSEPPVKEPATAPVTAPQLKSSRPVLKQDDAANAPAPKTQRDTRALKPSASGAGASTWSAPKPKRNTEQAGGADTTSSSTEPSGSKGRKFRGTSALSDGDPFAGSTTSGNSGQQSGGQSDASLAPLPKGQRSARNDGPSEDAGGGSPNFARGPMSKLPGSGDNATTGSVTLGVRPRGGEQAGSGGGGGARTGGPSGGLGGRSTGRFAGGKFGDPFGSGGASGGGGQGGGPGGTNGTGSPSRYGKRGGNGGGLGNGGGTGEGDGTGSGGKGGRGRGLPIGLGGGGNGDDSGGKGRGKNGRGRGDGEEAGVGDGGRGSGGAGSGERVAGLGIDRGRFRSGRERGSEIGRGIWAPGLVGVYYQDPERGQLSPGNPINWPTLGEAGSERFATHISKTIDFNWGEKAPLPGMRGTYWSVVWTGKIFVPKDDDYEFSLGDVDDGGRLYLDGKKIIDVWMVQKSTPGSGTMRLQKGDHKIVLQYAQGPATASSVRLQWKSSSFPTELVGAYIPGS